MGHDPGDEPTYVLVKRGADIEADLDELRRAPAMDFECYRAVVLAEEQIVFSSLVASR